MKKQYKIVLISLMLLVCLAVFGWKYGKPRCVEMEIVEKGILGTDFLVQGTLLPKHSKILNAASNGVIKKIPYKAGMAVSGGTVVLETGYESQADLEIQREQYRQQLTSARQNYDRLFGVNGTAKTSYETALSDYELAEQNYKNGMILAAGGSISQVEVKALENQRNKAKQVLIQAAEEYSDSNRKYYEQLMESYENQLAALEALVSPGEISMPYDGVIWEIYQEEGVYCTANQPVLKIYQPQDMKIQVLLLTEDAMRLEPGQKVSCEFSDGTVTEGEVQFISMVAGQTISTIGMEENRCIVEVKPNQVPESAGAGHQVDVVISLVAAEDVLTVPSSALVPLTGKAVAAQSGVYVAEHGKAVLKTIETGKRSGGRVEVTAGLSAGEAVLTDPYDHGVKKGTRVKKVLRVEE